MISKNSQNYCSKEVINKNPEWLGGNSLFLSLGNKMISNNSGFIFNNLSAINNNQLSGLPINNAILTNNNFQLNLVVRV